MADDFAANGLKTIIIDILNGDPLPADALGPTSTFDVAAWFAKHSPDQTRPPIDKVVDALKGEGVKKFAAVGYCFGGRYVFDLAFENVIQVAAVSHPSLLKVPEDLEVCWAFPPLSLLLFLWN